MRKNKTYPNIGLSSLTAVLLAVGTLLLSGCGQEKTEVAKTDDHAGHDHAAEEGYTPIPHSHEVASETCFICDASKRDKGRLWCKEHDRYEDRCWECQPQMRDADRPYCEEHGLYEDECFLCDPSRAEATAETAPEGTTP